ncbi:beta and beta-prime subunits of DNA dependent RNA-polymerase [Viridothelium virens]|uniref:DNA-directed RNA polymerase subunit n=1 Tax=Viridothelium virens TaxID=1048519 RepID=A0A6A6HEN8_VIRVR|nr:beta and beta-prime subunits of DNA dependent RNA-polymerase [Viridothelium virens]
MAGLLNISQPIFSKLGGVNFGVLSADEIRELSVKRISNPVTFNALLHPNPGGLYDPALGPYSDRPCETCRQLYSCSGHCGHIELPTPVYHPSFLDQCLRLLRGQCIYCNHFKRSKSEKHLLCCKLRLLRYGLVKECSQVENITDSTKKQSEDSDVSDSEQANILINARNKFVKKAIKEARAAGLRPLRDMGKDESVGEARAAVVKDFLANMTKGSRCANCQAYNPNYRKDGARQIFRKPLPLKHRRAMRDAGFISKNPLVEIQKQKQVKTKDMKQKAVHVDEAVADLDEQSPEEEEGEDLVEDAGITGGDTFEEEAAEENDMGNSEKETYLTPMEVRASLMTLFEREDEILRLVYGPQTLYKDKDSFAGADLFFLRALLVPPNRYRPEARAGDDQVNESPDNGIYKTILTQCENYASISRILQGLEDQPRRPRTINDLKAACVTVQDAVNHLIDSDRANALPSARNRLAEGIKQKLEKKEGLFRMNMMGKRVNFAARSVISPDPNIQTNEIGVPLVFARKLTYAEPVTDHNFAELKEAVMNGPNKWPGAVAVEDEKGLVMNLRYKNIEARQAIANQLMSTGPRSNGARPKKVHRHIANGDMVIMNRQPTLHKPSMMAHRVRVLPREKTIRMHYANCNTYNADFDGDEMNMHFPQNEIAQAEALLIADTDHQYLSATAGKPLRGLIQDHISISVRLTRKDTIFDKEKYFQLLNTALRPEDCQATGGRIAILPPAFLKPKPMWTGKQVISTILKNVIRPNIPGINLESKSQLSADQWGPNSEESKVLFLDGQLLMGILDKKQIGPSSGGFINTVYEAYGHTAASRLLSVLGRLLTRMLNTHANSCGMEDLVFTPSGEARRKELLKGADEVGLKVASKYVSLENKDIKDDDPVLLRRLEEVLRDDGKQMGLDQITNSSTKNLSSDITKNCLPSGLIKPFPRNHMQSMTSSGAKGSGVNANLISCNLGQQVLEGRRVPVMISGKTLPCFKPFETSIRAGGYIVDRFLTGLRPQETFFHAMAGREGLIDTAVKTASSGYLQRCVIKGMEGLKVEYDTSVRDADGSIVQFLYGEDGLDIVKVPYLYDFKFTANNFMAVFEQLGYRDNIQYFKNDEAADYNKAAIKKVRKTGNVAAMDPVLAKYNPGRWAGSTSEKFYNEIRAYIESNNDKLIRDKKKGITGTVSKASLTGVCDLKYLRSTIEPGEPVGIVAGQSIGEPSTQMTLNTFHLAGHSAKNVTLGIPRLRELLMTASASIKTPTMTMHMAAGHSSADADEIAKSISKVALSDVIDTVKVKEHVGSGVAHGEAKIYNIRIEFFPSGEYYGEYSVTPSDVVEALETAFLPRFIKSLSKELKKKVDEKSLATASSDALPEIGKSAGATEQREAAEAAEHEGGLDDGDDGDENDPDHHDGDATNTKEKTNQNQDVAYGAPDEDEAEFLRISRREASPAESEDETYGGSPKPAPTDGDDIEDDEGDGGDWTEADRNAMAEEARSRESRIKGKHHAVSAFSFDDKAGGWADFTLEYDASTPKILMLNLVEQGCQNAVVREVPMLSTCFAGAEKVAGPDGKEIEVPVVHTQGVNLMAMRDIPGIDSINVNKIFTNDIAAMLRLYGVEAARATIIRECDAVFSGHAISVDARHLQLVADFMTRGGSYLAFNRHGIKGSVSPFMKMSFETTVGFLRDAVLEEDWDELRGPSARIVAGAMSKVGTGSFDVLMDVAARDNDEKQEKEEEMEE